MFHLEKQISNTARSRAFLFARHLGSRGLSCQAATLTWRFASFANIVFFRALRSFAADRAINSRGRGTATANASPLAKAVSKTYDFCGKPTIVGSFSITLLEANV
jgi:hypothetical protein